MYYFIVNPKSRSGAGYSMWQKVQQILSAANVRYRAFFTKCPGHAISLTARISDHLKEGDIVAVLGGDGTLNEAINGLKYPDKTIFAYIPTGSGNDFARGMGLHTDLERAVRSILNPSKIQKLDIGQCLTDQENKRFAISSGIGFDAGICHEALTSSLKNFLNKIKLGKLTYTIIALRQLIFFRPFRLELTTDTGQKINYKDVYFVTAMNLQYEGGGFRFCPHADSADGYLDIFLIHGLSKLKILLFLPTAYFGRHTRFNGVELLRCRSVQFFTDRKMPIHIDGESAGFSRRILMSMEDKQLNVIKG
ncbi:MAG: diacylglycerol/lipid kinase family protein [Ruminococcus sp.]